MAARLASGMPPGLGPGARAAILSEAEAKERAAPEKRKVGMAAAREAAMSGARGDVMGVMDKLAYHLAQVVGSWCGRLAGQEEERADRGAARGPGPHGAPSPMPTAPRRAPVRTRADTPEHVPARLSEEEAASARCERQGRREAGKQEAAEREAVAVGARPLRLTTQVGLVALRRLRDRGWTATRAEVEANEAATVVDVAATATATGARSEGGAGERIGDGATPAAGLGRSPSQGSPPQGVHQAAADRAGPEAAGWEEEAEARRLWQREEAALYQFRRADVTARGRRSQADGRQAVVTREEAGLRLAEELSEDRLLVARETLELSVARQAERQHTSSSVGRRRRGRQRSARSWRCYAGTRRASSLCAASTRRRRQRTSVDAGAYGWSIGAVVPPARGEGGTT